MKFMSTFRLREGQTSAAAKRFLAGDAAPPAGLTILGRWHAADLSGGWVLTEADDAQPLYANAVKWAEQLEIHSVAVVEDQGAGEELAKKYGG